MILELGAGAPHDLSRRAVVVGRVVADGAPAGSVAGAPSASDPDVPTVARRLVDEGAAAVCLELGGWGAATAETAATNVESVRAVVGVPVIVRGEDPAVLSAGLHAGASMLATSPAAGAELLGAVATAGAGLWLRAEDTDPHQQLSVAELAVAEGVPAARLLLECAPQDAELATSGEVGITGSTFPTAVSIDPPHERHEGGGAAGPGPAAGAHGEIEAIVVLAVSRGCRVFRTSRVQAVRRSADVAMALLLERLHGTGPVGASR